MRQVEVVTILRDNNDVCPFCKSNLQGKPIPKEWQQDYGATHFSRIIAIYDRDKDRTVKYECPDCHKQWDR
jgi:ribosomal protein L37AE/L43A